MFTGIIESTGIVETITFEGSNRVFFIKSPISHELKTDQSVSHNGVCLTVEAVESGIHRVTAINETLSKTTMGYWKPGDLVNLERCLQFNGRIDGHFVQGHVDTVGECAGIQEQNGSTIIRMLYPEQFAHLMVEKGSVCLDGISLTIFNVSGNTFDVAIIPYTKANTNVKHLKAGVKCNLEFDIIGKHISRIMELRMN